MTGDLEVDDVAYIDGPIIMNENGPEGVKQQIQYYESGQNGERFQWDGASDSKRFEFSDDLKVFGDLEADIKNFVQNHPEREDLQLVYTALEGDEATVFTRGFARSSRVTCWPPRPILGTPCEYTTPSPAPCSARRSSP